MRYRQLGNSEHKVSVIGLGCIQLGDRADAAESEAIVHRAIQLGVNFFDVANVYMDGVSEEVLGKALGPKRKQMYSRARRAASGLARNASSSATQPARNPCGDRRQPASPRHRLD